MTQTAGQLAAAVAEARPCRRCGHSRMHHEHFHAGTWCAGCPCRSYRRPRPGFRLFRFRRRMS